MQGTTEDEMAGSFGPISVFRICFYRNNEESVGLEALPGNNIMLHKLLTFLTAVQCALVGFVYVFCVFRWPSQIDSV